MSFKEYPVNQQLLAELTWGDGEKLRAQAKQISQPFIQLRIACSRSIPISSHLHFRFAIGSVTLMQGEATVIASTETELEYELLLNVTGAEPEGSRGITERLAPFVLPEIRAQYLADEEQALAEGQQTWLAPWIESSYRLTLLVDVIARINSTMDLRSLLAAIMESAQIIMEADASSLMMLDRATNELIITVPTGPAQAEISGIRIPPGKGFGGWVAANGEPLVVADAQSDPRFFGDVSKSGFQTKSLICVPLRSPHGETIGVLQAINKKDGSCFTEMDIPLFIALADQAAIAIEKARLHEEALEKQKLEQQLDLAHQIQEGFWPKELPNYDGIGLAGMCVPATHVGGDYYDLIPIDEARCTLVVGDISGKGVAAALLMATLRAALRAQIENHHPIEDTVFLVNNTLVKDTPDEKFVTLFCGILDTTEPKFTYVNGGHNPPILYDQNTDEMKFLEEGGLLVGFLEDIPFVSSSESLRPGQVLVVYTDGVTEAQNQEEELFEEERLQALIRQHADKSAQQLMETLYQAVVDFTAGAPQFDDITLVVMKVEQERKSTPESVGLAKA